MLTSKVHAPELARVDLAGSAADDVVELAPDATEWREFVERCPSADVFHRPEWAGVLAECYRHRAFAIGLRRDGRLIAGLPLLETSRPFGGRRWHALPYSDACPPLVAPGAGPDALAALVTGIEQARTDAGVRSVEIRGDVAGAALVPELAGVVHTLPLAPDPEILRARCSKGTRWAIRVGEREGIAVRLTTARDDLVRTFYRLHVATRRRLGVPVQPRRFFELLWRDLIEPGGGFVVVAELGGTPIAAAVLLTGGRTLTYKYSASDPGHWRSKPNNAVLWEAIRTGCALGFERLDLGRSELENDGLRRFKRSWGAEEQRLVYAATPAPPGLPHRLAEGLIRSTPSIVCRAAGRALYRYAT